MGVRIHTYKLETTEQIRLVEENIELVGYTINKFFKYAMKDEDIYQIGCMGLCKAASTYTGKAKFSTYAVNCIKNDINNTYRDRNAIKRKSDHLTISLQYKPPDNETNTIEDMLQDYDFSQDLIKSLIIRDVLNNMTPVQEQILDMKMKGMTMEQIGDKLNMGRRRVVYIMEPVRNKLKEALTI